MAPREIKWGILATGGIALTFARDLVIPPSTRGVTNLTHRIVAAASSSSKARAEDFLKEVGEAAGKAKGEDAVKGAKAYGSYEELVNDKDVEVIYVATPHSHHYQNVRQCLEAGKNVLCEKAFTVNAQQARILVDLAKEKKLFLLEAVWTRFFPLSIYVRELITSGVLGPVHRVLADDSMAVAPDTEMDPSNRLVSPSLAGGALLDLGIYALTWVFQTLYTTQSPSARRAPTVASSIKTSKTGVDAQTSMLLTFPHDGGDAHAVATTSFYVAADPDKKGSAGPTVRVQGEKGHVVIYGPAHRPTRTKVVLADGTVEEKNWEQPGPGEGSGYRNGFGGNLQAEGEGQGMFWQADEAGRGLIEGKGESETLGWEESVVIMDTMDQIRKQAGLGGVYPREIESVEYPLKF